MPLNLKIITPEKEIFDGEVQQINLPTSDGEIGILPHHVDLMAKIVPGESRIKSQGKEIIMALGEGFIQVSQNSATILTDLAVDEKEIDERALEEARKRAELALEQKLSDEEYAETLAILEKSLAQLKVKRRHRVR